MNNDKWPKKNQFVIWFEGFDFLWWVSISLKATLFAHKRTPWRVKQGIVSKSIKNPHSFVQFIQGINCGVRRAVSVGRCAIIGAAICARREAQHKGSHSGIIPGRIDTSVINSPYYLLSGGSQPAGDIISHKSLVGPFCILLIVCILCKKIIAGPLVLMRNWHFLAEPGEDYVGR